MRRRNGKGTAKSRRPKPMRSRNLKASGSRRRSDSRPKQTSPQLRRELEEALEQQAATSEVLQVISKSRGELAPVFEAMLGNAVRICGAKFGNMWLREGDGFRIGAMHGTPQVYAD